MSEYLDRLQGSVVQWARRAAARHWLDGPTLAAVEQHRIASPANLFTGAERPLVVGLFGGTGVGKSSLLNRMARETVAQASAERPTSRGITVYVHKSVTVSHLPENFPMERMSATYHQRDELRHVMWIDMPDFDSVEASHRKQVDHWLPHLDVILYVVSPERYRDDDGWRLLQANARGHAWLFVMNQWDRGDPAQLDDFRQLLKGAGFADPMLFATDSRPSPARAADGVAARPTAESDTPLEALERTITELADSQLITQLGEHGELERARSLCELADSAHAGMGDAASLQVLTNRWQAHWSRVSEAIGEAASRPIEILARRHAQAPLPAANGPIAGLLTNFKPAFLARAEPLPNPVPAQPVGHPHLLDEALAERMDTGIDQFVQSAPEAGVPARVLAHLLDQGRAARLAHARDRVDQAVARSMEQPGTHWQRTVHRAAGLCAAFLPLAALCWIGIRIVAGFWRGASDSTAYLGGDFAIHSLLLLAVAWALPAIAQHRLTPSREAAAARGLRRGLTDALDELGEAIELRLAECLKERRQLDADYRAIWEESRSRTEPALPEQARRLLFEPVA